MLQNVGYSVHIYFPPLIAGLLVYTVHVTWDAGFAKNLLLLPALGTVRSDWTTFAHGCKCGPVTFN